VPPSRFHLILFSIVYHKYQQRFKIILTYCNCWKAENRPGRWSWTALPKTVPVIILPKGASLTNADYYISHGHKGKLDLDISIPAV